MGSDLTVSLHEKEIKRVPLSFILDEKGRAAVLAFEGMYRIQEHARKGKEHARHLEEHLSEAGFKGEELFWEMEKRLRHDIGKAPSLDDEIIKELGYNQWLVGKLCARDEYDKAYHTVTKAVANNMLYNVMQVLLNHVKRSYIQACITKKNLLSPEQLDDFVHKYFLLNEVHEYVAATEREGACWIIHKNDGGKYLNFWRRPNVFNPEAYSLRGVDETVLDMKIECNPMTLYKIHARQFSRFSDSKIIMSDNDGPNLCIQKLKELTSQEEDLFVRGIIEEMFWLHDVNRYAIYEVMDEEIIPYMQFRLLTNWVGKPLCDAGLRCVVDSMQQIQKMREEKRQNYGVWGIPPPYGG